MIVVNVELWPLGDDSNKRRLSTVTITNDGTGTKTRGNYRVEIYGKSGRFMRKKTIDNWPRNEKHVTELLLEALRP